MNEYHFPQPALLIARPALMDGQGPRTSGPAVASPSVTDSPPGCLPSTSVSGGEPGKDLLQLVEYAQSGADAEVDEGGNGFVETREMRATSVGTTLLAVRPDEREYRQCHPGEFAEALPRHRLAYRSELRVVVDIRRHGLSEIWIGDQRVLKVIPDHVGADAVCLDDVFHHLLESAAGQIVIRLVEIAHNLLESGFGRYHVPHMAAVHFGDG